jgi:hypothetical protein
VGYKLHMSGEIRDWLAGLCTSRPEAAAAVGKALTAMLDTGPGLGRLIVLALDTRPASANPVEDLDYAYDSRLRRLRAIRWTLAEVNGRAMQLRAARAEAGAAAPQAASATADTAELRELLNGLDRAEERLTRAHQRMQSDADVFRARKDALKARYTAAAIEDALAGIDAEMASALARDDLAGDTR